VKEGSVHEVLGHIGHGSARLACLAALHTRVAANVEAFTHPSYIYIPCLHPLYMHNNISPPHCDDDQIDRRWLI